MDTITFELKKADELPPVDGDYSPTAKRYECSDFYFGLAENPTGEVFKCLICYDFKYKMWRGVQAGVTKVIEYYYPIPPLTPINDNNH